MMTKEEAKRLTCPTCGEPARVIVITNARVRAALEADGTVGKILTMSPTQDFDGSQYECGGKHVWAPWAPERAR